MRIPPFSHSPTRRIIIITIQRPNLTLLSTPPFFSSMALSDYAGRPHFSGLQKGDEGQLMEQTSALLEAKWTLDVDRMGLEKRFEFASYAKALVSRFRCWILLLYVTE